MTAMTTTGTRGLPGLLRDARTIFIRQALPVWRSPTSLLFEMLQPLVFLVLFGPLVVGVGDYAGMTPGADAGELVSGWQWFVPAVLVMIALFGTTGTGYSLLTEMQTGSYERLLVTPMNRSAMLAGRTLNDVTTLLAQAVIIALVMIPFGFRLHPVGALVGLVLLAVLAVAAGTLSLALAIACRKSMETFWVIQQMLLFPLLFLSGMMLPLDVGPGWMQFIGRINPLTYVVEASRALFGGDLTAAAVPQGIAAVLVLAALGLFLGTRAMRKAAD